MPIPESPVKNDRFALFNANLAKNPVPLQDYPRMLTNPVDFTTTIVQTEKEHEDLVGTTKFKKEPLWGPPDRTKAPTQTETTQVTLAPMAEPNEVVIPSAARLRQGAKAKSLDGASLLVESIVPAQTVFEGKLPDPAQTLKNPSLNAKPVFKSE